MTMAGADKGIPRCISALWLMSWPGGKTKNNLLLD